MNDIEFRTFLDLLVCSDPWPIIPAGQSREIMEELAFWESADRGFKSWIEAYHEFKP
jgi:hypothetical protein